MDLFGLSPNLLLPFASVDCQPHPSRPCKPCFWLPLSWRGRFGIYYWRSSISDDTASPTVANYSCDTIPCFTTFTTFGSAVFVFPFFSALSSRLWRINRVFQGAAFCRRMKVIELSVMGPFLLSFSINCIMLTLRSTLAPSKAVQTGIDADPSDTLGVCENESRLAATISIGNDIVTVSAFVQQPDRRGWREISGEYSESKSLVLAIFI